MDLDLNISNYSISDLKHFFKLNKNFDENMLNKKMMELQDKIILSENVNNEFKRNFNHFLNEATTILMKTLHVEDAMQERKLDNTEINPTHPIVHIPKDPFIYTQSSKAFQGVVNPLERRIITKILSIDSAFRPFPLTTSPSNFVFQLQTPLHNVISMNLVSLELPRMWDTISSKLSNNVFTINIYLTGKSHPDAVPDASVTVTLPNGNYINNELDGHMNYFFGNFTNGLNFLVFKINAVTGKSYFYVNTDMDDFPYPNFYYELDFSASGLGAYLGFNKPKYIINMTDVYNDVFKYPSYLYKGYITGESSCGLVDNYLFIVVNDFNYNHETNIISSQTPNGIIGDNVLGRITLDVSPDNLLVNNSSDKIFKKREYFGPVRIRQLEVKLIDKLNRIIDSDDNFSLALEFQILYSS